MGLPNVYDYIHKHRERLMEEKRQKLLALESQRQHQTANNHVIDNVNHNHNPVNHPLINLNNFPNNDNDAEEQVDNDRN